MLSSLVVVLLAGGGALELGPIPAKVVRFYLVRHTEAYTNLEPPPAMPPEQMDALTPKGRAHAESVAAALKGQLVAVILHSPPKRIQETAMILRGSSDTPVRPEPRLRRIDYGQTEAGKPLALNDRVLIWDMGRDTRPKDGESLADVGLRVVSLLESLRKPHAGKGVVGVTHSEVIAAFLGHVQGVPGAKRHPPRVPLGSITVAEMDQDGAIRILLTKYEPPAP